MAEFALGLTKTAVEGTVSRVKSVIEEEAKLKVQVQHDLLFITGEFQMMQSFLNVTNSDRTKNETVRTWVRQLRDLAFDVEDCVEFVVHLDGKSAWWWRILPSCMAPPLPLDEAVAEIKQLKARVEDVSHRNTRYSLIIGNESGSSSIKPFAISATAEKPNMVAVAYDILKEVWEDTGKKPEDSISSLKTLITNYGNDLQVVSLWNRSEGAAHVGEIYNIINEAYCDKEICQEFTIRAWIKLMHPFNPDEFLKSLLTQFNATSSRLQANNFREKMKSPMEDNLIQQVSEHRYLVILEEVSTVVEWNIIRMYLPDNHNGSRIVVSTKKLGIALLCTGEPYQVSEIRRFSGDQYICAFFKCSGCRGDTGELNLKLRRGGIFSLLETGIGKSTLIDEVYANTMHKSEESSGWEIERRNWVDVPEPFDLDVFAMRLLLNFRLGDFHNKEIAAVGMMEDPGIVQGCCKILCESDCLIVINGLRSMDDWDLIKSAFLSKPTKSCVLVITNSESVARHCADDTLQVLNGKDFEAGVAFDRIKKGYSYYGTEGKINCRFSSTRREEARQWTDNYSRHLWSELDIETDSSIQESFYFPGVNIVCGNPASITKSAIVRQAYYRHIGVTWDESNPLKVKQCSWVDVSHPFSLKEFSWRLLLDFCSDDLETKDQIAAKLILQGYDPIPVCCKILRESECTVVIDGLESTREWDLIKFAFLSEASNSCIYIITNESVATQCENEGQVTVINIEDIGADTTHIPSIKEDRVFSRKREEARKWTKTFELVRRQNELDALTSFLQDPGVIFVCGIAGVGKSALVRTIYCDEITTKGSFKTSGWVDVPHPFNLAEFSWRLLVDFHSDNLQTKETAAFRMMEGHDPIQECRKLLHEDKCLVVIDGLRSVEDWDLIQATFLSEPISGCIIVITNESSVEAHCVDKGNRSFNVKGLEYDASLGLFNMMHSHRPEMTTHEKKVLKLIMTKCGGLPEVIVAIEKYSYEVKDATGEEDPKSSTSDAIGEEDLNPSSASLLDCLRDDFMGMLQMDIRFHGLSGLFCWMRSYFDACSDTVKPCIFYLSVFPANQNIRQRRLLRRWIAEGYSRDTSAGCTAEEKGEMLFTELAKLSIIQELGIKHLYTLITASKRWEFTRKTKKICQVNGFFREYIMSRPMEDNLVFALEGRCSPNSQRTGQHLTIRSCWDRDENVFQSMELSRVRSLTVFGEWRSFFISSSSCNNMRMLRVLDLEDTSGVSNFDIEHIGKLLPRLKFLSLRGCREISLLPDSLGFLRQLQTLDVRHTSVVMLPPAIFKLQKLQYIRAGNTIPLYENEYWITTLPAGEKCTSTPLEDGDGTVVAAEDDMASTTLEEDKDDTVVATLPAADKDRISIPQESDDTVVATLPAANDDQISTLFTWSMRRTLGSWLSKIRRRQLVVSIRKGGVKVPVAVEIGKLTALHTLGVINVGGCSSGEAFLKELKKLTQLRKLAVCGINRGNWHKFCGAISGHGHLESLSVRFELREDKQDHLYCLDDISQPPKTLKSLKLYGPVHKLSLWIKQLDKLEKLELQIATQEDLDVLDELSRPHILHRLLVKPIQDGVLFLGRDDDYQRYYSSFFALRIDCISKLKLTLGGPMMDFVEHLIIHCYGGSSLELSGLDNLRCLTEVWLKGSYSNALKQQVANHYMRPVLNLE